MPRITKFEIFEEPVFPKISIKRKFSYNELADVTTECYQKLMAYLESEQMYPMEGLFLRYYDMDIRKFDRKNLNVEIGYTLARPLPGNGEIEAGFTEGGRFVSCMFRGDHFQALQVYGEIAIWLNENGYSLETYAEENFYNDNELGIEEFITRTEVKLIPVGEENA